VNSDSSTLLRSGGRPPTSRPVLFGVAALTVVAGMTAGLIVWMSMEPGLELNVRRPGASAPPVGTGSEPQGPGLGSLSHGDGKPAETTGSWPCFRGPGLNGISDDKTPLATAWPESGPPVLWSIELGEGYAGAAVRAGRVYVLDYDREAQTDVLRCMSMNDGRDIWRFSYPVKVKRSHGMSRTIPSVDAKHVVSLGPKCHVLCLRADTGERLWSIDLVREHGTKVPPWYAGQCPLIDGDRVVLAPAGPDVLMLAVELATGKVLWRTPNPDGWRMSHSSVVPLELGGRRTYMYCAQGGVALVAADDGSLLWRSTDWRIGIATIPAPVAIGDGRVFLSGGYNAGCMMLRFQEPPDTSSLTAAVMNARIEFRHGGRKLPAPDESRNVLRSDEFGSTQQTPIHYQGHIYGVVPDGQLACLTRDGKLAWKSGGTNRFGIGPYLLAQGLLYVLSSRGKLTLVAATPSAYQPLAEAQVLKNGRDAWGPMALIGDRLILRDLTRMVCLDVGEN
jgi:outer membrane protein assembly factor BamB